RRRHTRLQGDWSSDVCSSDLRRSGCDRVVLIEDTRELQCAAPNLVSLRTKDRVATLTDLVRSALRLRPDRIPIGEVRGPVALDQIGRASCRERGEVAEGRGRV